MGRPKKNPEGVDEVMGPETEKPALPKLKPISADHVELRWEKDKKGGVSDYKRHEPPRSTSFVGCSLDGEDLSGKTLQGIVWKESVFNEVNFDNSDLRWNDFRGCKGLETCSFEGANLFEAISATGKVIGTNAVKPWE